MIKVDVLVIGCGLAGGIVYKNQKVDPQTLIKDITKAGKVKIYSG